MIENSVCCEVASRWFSEDKAKIWAALSLGCPDDWRQKMSECSAAAMALVPV